MYNIRVDSAVSYALCIFIMFHNIPFICSSQQTGDPRSLAFLQPYLKAAKQIMEAFSWEHSPLARVECSDWPDICDEYNVTRYPTVKIFQRSRFLKDYKGALDTDSIVKAYKL